MLASHSGCEDIVKFLLQNCYIFNKGIAKGKIKGCKIIVGERILRR